MQTKLVKVVETTLVGPRNNCLVQRVYDDPEVLVRKCKLIDCLKVYGLDVDVPHENQQLLQEAAENEEEHVCNLLLIELEVGGIDARVRPVGPEDRESVRYDDVDDYHVND